MVLEFIAHPGTIDAFTDESFYDDDFLQGLVAYFERPYIGGGDM